MESIMLQIMEGNLYQEEIEELPEKIVCRRDSDFFEPEKRELNADEPNPRPLLGVLDGRLNHSGKKEKESVLPVSNTYLVKAPSRKKALNPKEFLLYIFWCVYDIPPQSRIILLVACIGFLGNIAKNVPAQFDLQLGEAPQTLLNTGEAFAEFFPAMLHIMMFILCFCQSCMLVWSLQPGLQMFFTLLLIASPLYFFHQLWLKSSGAHVACGSIKMSLIWFSIFGAFGLSLICCFLILISIYISWRYIHEGRPRVKATEVNLDDLTEILAQG